MKKCLDFAKTYFDFIENGHNLKNPFKWLYGLIAVLNVLLPLFVLYGAITAGAFRMAFAWVLLFLLIWVIIAALGVFGFVFWWDRKDKVAEYSTKEKDEFIMTPVIAHLIKTLGEWIGTYVGVFGALISLIVFIFGGANILYAMGFGGFAGLGWIGIILFPIWGFLIIALSRFAAEQFRALAAIANNTKK